MLTFIRSSLGWKEKPAPTPPPPVAITGVRIPADGTPAHLLSLTTTSASEVPGTDGFLFHIPDVRQSWKMKQAWEFRDIQRFDLLQDAHIPLAHHFRQKRDLQRLLVSPQPRTDREQIHLRQRYLVSQQYHVLRQQHASCIGGYYVFYSFAVDDLPKNPSVPAWISDMGHGGHHQHYHGDVFIIKLAPHEYEENAWAVYEDIDPQFLGVLAEGPLERSSFGIVHSQFMGTIRRDAIIARELQR